jgi:tetratricopeptide (TPR) repeat protein
MMFGFQRSATAFGTLILVLLLAATLYPSRAEAAKTLASEALAAAAASGSIDEVRQDLMMDFVPRQRYEFDEPGIEALGRSLCTQDNYTQGIEILQLNQMLFSDSPAAANALADAYRDSGDDITARVYYDTALRLDPENAHAKQAVAQQGGAEQLATEAVDPASMSGAEYDVAAMQEAMAQMGQEIPPEQLEKMQEAMAQMEAYQQDPSTHQEAMRQAEEERSATRAQAPPAPQPAHESEFCEVLHRFNADKRIEEEIVRARVHGEYGVPGVSNKTWNVETTCGDFLVAVPLWADVSPPIMQVTGERSFGDSMGGTWVFQITGGQASGVVYTDSSGAVQEMQRLGDPRSLE